MAQIQATLRLDKEDDRYVLGLSKDGNNWIDIDVSEDEANELSNDFNIEIEDKEETEKE